MLTKLIVAVPLIVLVFFVSLAEANHAWGPYHWGRTANPFTIQLGDNVSSNWEKYLKTAASDWGAAAAFDAVVVPGKTKSRTCAPIAGRVEVCSYKYGNNGWLGIAQVWVDGDHITMGTVKMNDSYFTTRDFNTPTWRNLVMCQEVAHVFGLDHQDEDFSNANLGTCTDYTNDPTTNQHPNQHDYDMLASIYNHLDSNNTMLTNNSQNPAIKGKTTGEGVKITPENKGNGKISSWESEMSSQAHMHGSHQSRNTDDGMKVFTFVAWAE